MDKLVELIPSLLWFFLVVFILLLFYRPIRDNLLPKLGVFDPEKGTPAKAFGITNRPDELLHLTLDALERKKY